MNTEEMVFEVISKQKYCIPISLIALSLHETPERFPFRITSGQIAEGETTFEVLFWSFKDYSSFFLP